MAVEVIMPKAGMAMEEGTIVKWYKKEGDQVEAGEALLEIITDKVNMEVEAEVSGVLLKIVGKEGQVLPVFTPIAYIGKEGEEVETETTGKNPEQPEKKEKEELKKENVSVSEKKVRATPAARKTAKESDLELRDIKGSGPKGRIQKKDVLSLRTSVNKMTPLAEKIAALEGVDPALLEGSGYDGKITKEDVMKQIGQRTKEKGKPVKGKIVPLTPMRKTIGKRMSDSFFTAPTFTLNIEVDMRKTKEMKNTLKAAIEEETGFTPTITDILVMACAKNLKKHPAVNTAITEEGLLIYDDVNIAFAVGLEEGLFVPVIKNADKLTLSEIVTISRELVSKAEHMSLRPDEQEGSTFTISNLGMYGISHFNPIINPPNSAILGVGAITDRPIVRKGEIRINPMMNLSMTIDHRAIDGAPGARFMQNLKELLEDPIKLLT